jgi:hypothetical protein
MLIDESMSCLNKKKDIERNACKYIHCLKVKFEPSI